MNRLRLRLFLFIIPLIHSVIAIKNPHEKCEFKDTVDLTNHKRFDNGSYFYQNILIPENKVAHYDYHLQFRNEQIDAELHLRGCVCDAKNRVYCMKLCCQRGHFYNITSKSCNRLPVNRLEPTNLDLIHADRKFKKNVNIHDHFVNQIGLPCETPDILLKEDKWGVLENGILLIFADNVPLDTVSYCFTPHRWNGSNEDVLTPMSCPMKSAATIPFLLNTYAMAVSVLFLIPTIILHLLIKELRSNLGGKLLISYLISMTVAYSFISYINIFVPRLPLIPCRIIGFSGLFFFMSVFMWLSVLCFDIWNNFKEANVDFNAQNSGLRFAVYSIYAWGSAGLLTSVALWAQLSDLVPENLKPGIGIQYCFLDTSKWSAALYFYFPNLIILLFNIIIFTKTALKIYRVRRDVATITNRESFLQENAAVIMRLFLIMGISWIMDTISYCLRKYSASEYLFAVTDFCNATQGVLIFMLFVLRPKVINLIKKRFQKTKTIRPRFSTKTRETIFSRITSSSGVTGSTTAPMSP